MLTNKEKAIQSAQTVSMLRAVAAREADPGVRGGDYLAGNFLDDKFRLLVRLMPQRLLKKLIQFISPGSYCFMITRTRHFDQTLLQELREGIQQVVILGAGYDTRPFRFADHLAKVSVFEVDFPGTQLFKKRKLEKLFKGIPDHITFIPLDFNEEPFEKALLKKGFLPGLKSLFLWEGVSYYLPEPVVKNVLRFVSSCIAGSSILFDYATKDFVNGDHSTYGGRQIARWLRKIKEPFLFGMNADETPGFLQNCRLSVVSDYGPAEFENMFLKTTKGSLYGKTLGHIRMVHARAL